MVNTIFTAFELVADTTIFWLPLYWEAKLLFVLWLALPSTRGASVLYHGVVSRYLEAYEPDIDRHLEAAGAKLGDLADGVRGAVAAQVRRRGGLLLTAATQLVAEAASAAAEAGPGAGAGGATRGAGEGGSPAREAGGGAARGGAGKAQRRRSGGGGGAS